MLYLPVGTWSALGFLAGSILFCFPSDQRLSQRFREICEPRLIKANGSISFIHAYITIYDSKHLGIFQWTKLIWSLLTWSILSKEQILRYLLKSILTRWQFIIMMYIMSTCFLKNFLQIFVRLIRKIAISFNSNQPKTYIITDFSTVLYFQGKRHRRGKLKGIFFVNLPGPITESFWAWPSLLQP